MGATCSNHGCCSMEEDKTTFDFSNNFSFKENGYAVNNPYPIIKEEPKAKSKLIFNGNNLVEDTTYRKLDTDLETVNVSHVNDLDKSKDDKLESNAESKGTKIKKKQSIKSVSFSFYDPSKVTLIQKKFHFFKAKHIFQKKKNDLSEYADKLYYSALSQFTTKENNQGLPPLNNLDEMRAKFEESLPEKCLLLKTKLLLKNKTFYSGEVNIQGMKYGLGTLRKYDKSLYEGFWINDELKYGRIMDSTGTIYEGEFKNNKLCGQGSKTTKDGTISVGMFEDGLRNGLGTENSKLTFYEGEFNNDKKHGKGKMIFKSLEEIYEGDFIDDKITGTGKKTWKNKDSYEGNFEDNQMHGKGIYFWSDGSRYEGDYIYNVKEGLGKFYWPNGNIFEGEFSNGLPNGKGIFNNRGVRYHCEFTDGRMTKKGSMIK